MTSNRSIGDDWVETCSAEGWPLPTLVWFFNSKPVFNDYTMTLIDDPSVAVVHNHHKKFKVNSNILIKNLTRSSNGTYTCVMNGKQLIKSVELIVDDEQKSPADSDNPEVINKKQLSNNIGSILVTAVLIAIVIGVSSVAGLFY